MDSILVKLLQPLYRLGQPHTEGLEHVDSSRPALYVANHTTLGVLDVPFFYIALREHAGVRLRGLAHKLGFKTPMGRALLHGIGAVEGTRANCAKLMEAIETAIKDLLSLRETDPLRNPVAAKLRSFK